MLAREASQGSRLLEAKLANEASAADRERRARVAAEAKAEAAEAEARSLRAEAAVASEARAAEAAQAAHARAADAAAREMAAAEAVSERWMAAAKKKTAVDEAAAAAKAEKAAAVSERAKARSLARLCEGLPQGWTAALDPNTAQPYFIHGPTQEVSWVRPTAAPVKASAAAESVGRVSLLRAGFAPVEDAPTSDTAASDKTRKEAARARAKAQAVAEADKTRARLAEANPEMAARIAAQAEAERAAAAAAAEAVEAAATEAAEKKEKERSGAPSSGPVTAFPPASPLPAASAEAAGVVSVAAKPVVAGKAEGKAALLARAEEADAAQAASVADTAVAAAAAAAWDTCRAFALADVKAALAAFEPADPTGSGVVGPEAMLAVLVASYGVDPVALANEGVLAALLAAAKGCTAAGSEIKYGVFVHMLRKDGKPRPISAWVASQQAKRAALSAAAIGQDPASNIGVRSPESTVVSWVCGLCTKKNGGDASACVACGRQRSKHVGNYIVAAATPAKAAPEARPGPTPLAARVASARPDSAGGKAALCEAFVVDLAAPAFGTCKCGWPKAEHRTASLEQRAPRSDRMLFPKADAEVSEAAVASAPEKHHQPAVTLEASQAAAALAAAEAVVKRAANDDGSDSGDDDTGGRQVFYHATFGDGPIGLSFNVGPDGGFYGCCLVVTEVVGAAAAADVRPGDLIAEVSSEPKPSPARRSQCQTATSISHAHAAHLRACSQRGGWVPDITMLSPRNLRATACA